MATIRKNFPVQGLGCAACVARVQGAIKAVNGVENCNVSLASNSAQVDYDPKAVTASEIKKAVKFRVPIIFLGGWVTSSSENVVAQDNAYGTDMAMDYLFGLGHRKIAYITDKIRSNTNQTKLNGYRSRMLQNGLRPAIFVDEEANLIQAGARQAALMLDTGEKFTAILASKDLVAIGAMNEIRSRGLRIPEDISVVGFGGSEASSLPMIDLTTIAQPKKDLAENLIRIMVSLAEYGHDAPPQHYFAKPKLIERKSCRHI